MPRKLYNAEFHRRAVGMYKQSDETLKTVANRLGIHISSLQKWVNQYDIDEGNKAGTTTEAEQEIKRLKKQLEESQQTVELLKKAAAAFAVETNTKN